MSTSISSSKRLPWIDIAKGVAIILMIYGHVLGSGLMRNAIFSFHMPLFFILAGYTFSTKRTFGELARSSAKRLLLPLVLTWAAEGILANIVTHTPWDATIATKLFWGAAWTYPHSALGITIPTLGALWFLWALFWARLIFRLILNVSRSSHSLRLILTVLVFYAGYFLGSHFPCPMDIDIACASCMFMWAGYEMKELRLGMRYEALSLPIRAIIVFAIMLLWLPFVLYHPIELGMRRYGPYGISCIGAIAGSLSTFALCKEIGNIPPLRQVLSWAGINSLVILCMHHLETFCLSVIPLFRIINKTFIPNLPDSAKFPMVGAESIALCFLMAFCWKLASSAILRMKRP